MADLADEGSSNHEYHLTSLYAYLLQEGCSHRTQGHINCSLLGLIPRNPILYLPFFLPNPNPGGFFPSPPISLPKMFNCGLEYGLSGCCKYSCLLLGSFSLNFLPLPSSLELVAMTEDRVAAEKPLLVRPRVASEGPASRFALAVEEELSLFGVQRGG